MPIAGTYKRTTPLSDRLSYTHSFLPQDPTNKPLSPLPIILERSTNTLTPVPDLSPSQFAVPRWQKVSEFMGRVRYKMKVDSSVALFLLLENGEMPLGSMTMGEVYQIHKDQDDGVLYLVYAAENTFGL